MSGAAYPPPRRRPTSHRPPPNYAFRRFLALMIVLTLGVLMWRAGAVGAIGSLFRGDARREASGPTGTGTAGGKTQASPPVTPSPTESTPGPINTKVPGLTTFRGNATRSYYGEGPIPANPKVLWRYPESGGMCSVSSSLGKTTTWCGTGWTGQPNVIPRRDGVTELRFGAYDGHYHFLNAMTGEPVREDVVTDDLAKGSATSDPDGYPLYYGGSRDNYLRIVALDRGRTPEVLWSLSASSAPNPVWNNDWDGAPLIVDDHMLVGGENSWFYVVRLNRHYDSSGLVQVDPQIVMLVPGYDEQLLADLPDEDISIESSVAFHDGVAYFVNSGGLVQGWDISDILRGGDDHERVFRFWNGDDSDATVVIDEEGFLYVARHAGGRSNPKITELGDLMKLDPRRKEHPVVWSVHVTGGSDVGGGIWATPALYKGTVWISTNYGELIAVDQDSGKVLSKTKLPGPTWGSPVPIDDQLLLGDCEGVLHNFDISQPSSPRELWAMPLEGCIESTPAVWEGTIWVGARGGGMYAIGDGSSPTAGPSPS